MNDTYTTPEGFDLPKRLLFPEVRRFDELFTFERFWDFATMNYKGGKPQPETPQEITREGWDKTVSRFCSVRVPGSYHMQVTPTALVLDRIYADEAESLDFAFFDRVSFELIFHESTNRVLVVASASGITASRWLAYIDPATIMTPHIDLTGRTGAAIRAYLEPVTGKGEPRPTIVLYDREAATGRGLFITSYYVSTLLSDRERLERYGLTLHGGIPEWSLSAEEITRLLDWGRRGCWSGTAAATTAEQVAIFCAAFCPLSQASSAENGPPAYTREDMDRAFNEGVLAMSRALQGGNEPVSPYRVLPTPTH